MNLAISAKLTARHYLHPKYWPTWMGLLCMWTIAHLPIQLQFRIGSMIGRLILLFATARRHVCERNIQLCFPDLSPQEQKTLVRRTFESNGIGLAEIAISWFRNPEDYRGKFTLNGIDNLKAVIERGQGVLLVCAHFTSLELAGTFLSLFHPLDVTYRKQKNPIIQHVMTRARNRHFGAVIEREDVRSAVKSLKSNMVLWFAPDQDYGANHSAFVPFFGVEAATITSTSRFAKIGNSAVIFFNHFRKEDGTGYELTLSPVLEDFPSSNQEEDAKRINKLIEDAVREHPDQYIWLHKRFKTQRTGRPSVYQENC